MILFRLVFKNILNSSLLKKVENFNNKIFSGKYLLYTNVTISLGLSSTGDILEQKYEKHLGLQKEWNAKRTVHMGISGVAIGIICHYWYNYLDKRMPGRTLSTILKKVVLDQIICSPLYISAFFLTLGALEDKSFAETCDEFKQKAWKLYAAEWAVWPIAQVINFYWLPTRYRILYDNTISLGYDVFTSQVKYKDS